MNIKLTPIPVKNKKEKYEVVLRVMHGDANKYEDIKIPCKNQEEFIKMMNAPKSQPLDGSAGGDESEYSQWCEDNFSDYVPFDCIFIDNRAKVDLVEGFYYDKKGVKFKAEVTP
jgi:hypothetical protein